MLETFFYNFDRLLFQIDCLELLYLFAKGFKEYFN